MAEFNHGAFIAELRARQGSVPQKLYDDLMAALDAGLGGVLESAGAHAAEPKWLTIARDCIGIREIAGAKHNPTILGWIKALGGWFTDDETPWCGTFVGWVLAEAGVTDRPKHWYRALDWASWGKQAPLTLGAIAVFGREGGGHVGFVVGQNATQLYVLGGNQSNMVNIMPIARSRLVALRWPMAKALVLTPPPAMTGGAVSRNEA